MAQNDFLQFDENNENVLTQDAYREDEQRKSGAKSGVARSSLFNKVLRQVSTFVAGFGQFISEKNINVLEDLNSVKTALTNLFTAKNVGVSTEVQTLLGVDNVDDGLKKLSNKKELIGVYSFPETTLSIKNMTSSTKVLVDFGDFKNFLSKYDFILYELNCSLNFKGPSSNTQGTGTIALNGIGDLGMLSISANNNASLIAENSKGIFPVTIYNASTNTYSSNGYIKIGNVVTGGSLNLSLYVYYGVATVSEGTITLYGVKL